jgi:hypothetical protein
VAINTTGKHWVVYGIMTSRAILSILAGAAGLMIKDMPKNVVAYINK